MSNTEDSFKMFKKWKDKYAYKNLIRNILELDVLTLEVQKYHNCKGIKQKCSITSWQNSSEKNARPPSLIH